MTAPDTFTPIATRTALGWRYLPGWDHKTVAAMRAKGEIITALRGADLLAKRGAGHDRVVTDLEGRKPGRSGPG